MTESLGSVLVETKCVLQLNGFIIGLLCRDEQRALKHSEQELDGSVTHPIFIYVVRGPVARYKSISRRLEVLTRSQGFLASDKHGNTEIVDCSHHDIHLSHMPTTTSLMLVITFIWPRPCSTT